MTEHLWQRSKSVETLQVLYIIVTSIKGRVTAAYPFTDKDRALEAGGDIVDASGGDVDVNIVESLLDGM